MKIAIGYHHIGMYVENLEKTTAFYETVFDMKVFLRRKAKYLKDSIDLQIVFLENDRFIIELIGSIKGNNTFKNTHIALNVQSITNLIHKLKENLIDFEMFLNDDGSIDFIKFADPELNVFEIFEKKSI